MDSTSSPSLLKYLFSRRVHRLNNVVCRSVLVSITEVISNERGRDTEHWGQASFLAHAQFPSNKLLIPLEVEEQTC